jgi:ABC-2 type transport system ATP-binding protein
MPQQVLCATQTAASAVELRGVTKQYFQMQRQGSFRDALRNMVRPQKRIVTALDNVSLRVERGEFLAYAGANGAGKSTTIKLMSGILQPNGGEVQVLGLDPSRSRIALMARIGVLFGQRTELWWDHPVSVSFQWKQAVWDIPHERYERMRGIVCELLDLGPLMNTFARELSLGQRMRADLGLLLLHEPELILLDEPTLGLDVLAKRQVIEFLKTLNREQGTTIIVTSHDMDDLEEMARRIVLLSSGSVAFDGGFEELRSTVGGLRRLVLTTDSDTPPVLQTAAHRVSNGIVHEYEFDLKDTPVRAVFAEASQTQGIRDIEVRRVPIEHIIAELYQSWKTQSGAEE